MKLNNLSLENYSILNQGKHGIAQQDNAIDVGLLGGSAPADGSILRIYTKTNSTPPYPARLSFFDFGKDNWFLQMVHAKPKGKVGAQFKDRQPLWDSTWHHLHVAIKVDGRFYPVFDFMRRDIELYWLRKGQKHPVWTTWSTYADRQLPPYTNNPDNGKILEMVDVQQTIVIKNNSGNNLNIRKTPTSKSESIGLVKPGDTWGTRTVARGETVDGNSTWYYHNDGGYVTGRYLTEIPQGVNQAELEALKAENDVLEKEVEKLEQEKEDMAAQNLTSNLVYDYTKKIDDLINKPNP